MFINHTGHDHDCDQPTVCACGEVVRDPEHHHCLPIGWIDSWQLIGNPPEAYIPLTAEKRAYLNQLSLNVTAAIDRPIDTQAITGDYNDQEPA